MNDVKINNYLEKIYRSLIDGSANINEFFNKSFTIYYSDKAGITDYAEIAHVLQDADSFLDEVLSVKKGIPVQILQIKVSNNDNIMTYLDNQLDKYDFYSLKESYYSYRQTYLNHILHFCIKRDLINELVQNNVNSIDYIHIATLIDIFKENHHTSVVKMMTKEMLLKSFYENIKRQSILKDMISDKEVEKFIEFFDYLFEELKIRNIDFNIDRVLSEIKEINSPAINKRVLPYLL